MNSEKNNIKLSSRLRQIFKVPHVFALMFFIIVVATALTYIVPAGEFDRVEDVKTGRTIVEEGSFQSVPNDPVSILEIPGLIISGLNDASGIILFIFIVGGAFRIITATGAFDAVIGTATDKLGKKEILIIPLLITLFAIFGATAGMSIEQLGFVPIVIALARSLNYDALTGMAIVLVGAFSGFISGVMNPFTVGVAQEIAGVPIYSGMWLRVILLVVLISVSSFYIIRYAKKVQRNPAHSYVIELEKHERLNTNMDLSKTKFQIKHILVIISFIVGISILIWGVTNNDWYIEQMAALFLAMGIVSGSFAGLSPSRIAEEFVAGAKAVTLGALVVGLARAIPIALENGVIIDSLVNAISSAIMLLPDFMQILSIYFAQVGINFFINSGSGQAAVTMPVMVPLGDLIGITRQTIVLSFQLGDGITNLIFPTATTMMAYLATAGIPYQKWVKFIWPLALIFIAIGAVFVIFASVIQY